MVLRRYLYILNIMFVVIMFMEVFMNKELTINQADGKDNIY